MLIEKTFQGIRVSAIVQGRLTSRHYIDYTEAEAIEKFRAEFEAEGIEIK